MSLYEMFHSDTNKNYMYDMIVKLIKQKHKIDIIQDKEFKEFYNESITKVFTENNFDDISNLNKALLDYNIQHFESKNGPNSNVEDEYEKMIRLRNESLTTEQKPTIVEETPNVDEKSTIIEESTTVEEPNVIEKSNLEPIHITSSKRSNLQSSRYNYKINLKRNNIESKNIKAFSRLIIPIEKHYLFSLPLLKLKIPELSIDLILQQEKIIHHLDKMHGIYEPIEKKDIICLDELERITIDIRDITDIKYPHDDILKINIVELKKNTIYFTCSQIYKEDFRVNDNIKIINIDQRFLYLLKDPLKIKKINKNIIQCSVNYEDEDKTFTNVDMKIMNLNNQNLLYFNL